MALALLPSFAPAATTTVPVVVAARDLPAGTLLGAEDLTTADVPSALVPAGALGDPRAVQGHRIATALGAGAAVPSTALRSPDDPGTSPGRAVIAAPADRALVPYLTAGTAVEVVVPDAGSAEPRRIRAVVAQADDSAGHANPGMSGTESSGGAGAVVLLSVEPTDVPDIAYATREGWVVLAVVG